MVNIMINMHHGQYHFHDQIKVMVTLLL